MIDQQDSPQPEETKSEGSASESGSSPTSTFFESLETFYDATTQLLESSAHIVVDEAAKVRKAVTEAGGAVLEEGAKLFAQSLSFVAADPTKGPSVIEDLIALTPIVGTSKMYSNAWLKYHTGVEKNDAEMVQGARRECLVALVSAGLDVTTLGASAVSRSALGVALRGVTGAHVLASFESVKQKVINPFADQLLENPTIAQVVDTMLKAVKPTAAEKPSDAA